jgi:hypothetical protein
MIAITGGQQALARAAAQQREGEDDRDALCQHGERINPGIEPPRSSGWRKTDKRARQEVRDGRGREQREDTRSAPQRHRSGDGSGARRNDTDQNADLLSGH